MEFQGYTTIRPTDCPLLNQHLKHLNTSYKHYRHQLSAKHQREINWAAHFSEKFPHMTWLFNNHLITKQQDEWTFLHITHFNTLVLAFKLHMPKYPHHLIIHQIFQMFNPYGVVPLRTPSHPYIEFFSKKDQEIQLDLLNFYAQLIESSINIAPNEEQYLCHEWYILLDVQHRANRMSAI